MRHLTVSSLLLLAACNPLAGSAILGHWEMNSGSAADMRLSLTLDLTDDGAARLARVEDWSTGCLDAMRLEGTFSLPSDHDVTFSYTDGWEVTSDECPGGAWIGDAPASELAWRSVTQTWVVSQNILALGGTQVPGIWVRN